MSAHLVSTRSARLGRSAVHDLDASAGGDDLGASALAHLVDLDRETLRDVAVRQQLRRPALVRETGGDEDVAVDGRTVIEAVELTDVDHGVPLARRIAEPTFRQPALQRHLAAFVAGR